MAKLRMPISAKVLLWFLVNVVLLLGLGYGFIRSQFRVGLDWILAGPTGERIERIANTLSDELIKQPESEWPVILKRYHASQGVQIALFASNGEQVVGDRVEVPREVKVKLIDKRSSGDIRPPPPRRNGPPSNGPLKNEQMPPKPRFIVRSEQPVRYWAGIHLDIVYHDVDRIVPLTLVMISDSLTAGGLFLDPWPWLALLAGGVVISVLVWMPFVSGMTRAILRVNTAASRIAHGKFEVRVPEKRGDELGELASSVNTMAGQLGTYVEQQRRITSDVAHELCSPIARMQMALGVVEQRGTPEQATYLKKLDAELQHMAKLVEEVLAFSKAETVADRVEAADLEVADVVQKAVEREGGGAEVQVSVEDGMQVHAPREALDRAVANLIRNAVRYAASGGPIEVSAARNGATIRIVVRDHGPGVPVEALGKLFEPFYRVDAARARNSGGAGLGLAIVQRCINACGGSVEATLPPDGGLQMTLELPAK